MEACCRKKRERRGKRGRGDGPYITIEREMWWLPSIDPARPSSTNRPAAAILRPNYQELAAQPGAVGNMQTAGRDAAFAKPMRTPVFWKEGILNRRSTQASLNIEVGCHACKMQPCSHAALLHDGRLRRSETRAVAIEDRRRRGKAGPRRW